MRTKNISNSTAPAIMCQTPSNKFSAVKERYMPQPITIKPSQRNLSNTNFKISNSWASDKRFFPFDDCRAILDTSLSYTHEEASGVVQFTVWANSSWVAACARSAFC